MMQALYAIRDQVTGAIVPLAVIAGLVLLAITLLLYSGESGTYSSR